MADVQPLGGFSRRRAILTGAGLVAAGAAGGLVTARLADSALAASAESPKESPKVPVMVHLRDAHAGQFDVFVGDVLVEIVDTSFAAKLVRAAATA